MSKFDYSSNETPEIRIAPEHKAINPDNIPKRPQEKQPDMFSMNLEELLAFMEAHLKMRVNLSEYNDPFRKNVRDGIQKIDMTALRVFERAFIMHLVKDHGYGEILLKSGE